MRAWTMMILVAGALSACATVDGIGQDISSTSRTVQSWF